MAETRTFLGTIMSELEAVDPKDYIEPDGNPGPLEREVGMMSNHLKALFSLWKRTARRADQAVLEVKHARGPQSDRVALRKAARDLLEKADLLGRIFAASVAREHNLDAVEVHLCSGFRVAIPDEKKLAEERTKQVGGLTLIAGEDAARLLVNLLNFS